MRTADDVHERGRAEGLARAFSRHSLRRALLIRGDGAGGANRHRPSSAGFAGLSPTCTAWNTCRAGAIAKFSGELDRGHANFYGRAFAPCKEPLSMQLEEPIEAITRMTKPPGANSSFASRETSWWRHWQVFPLSGSSPLSLHETTFVARGSTVAPSLPGE